MRAGMMTKLSLFAALALGGCAGTPPPPATVDALQLVRAAAATESTAASDHVLEGHTGVHVTLPCAGGATSVASTWTDRDDPFWSKTNFIFRQCSLEGTTFDGTMQVERSGSLGAGTNDEHAIGSVTLSGATTAALAFDVTFHIDGSGEGSITQGGVTYDY